MKKVQNALIAIWEIIKNPWLLNRVLADDEIWSKRIEKKHGLTNLPIVAIDTLCPNFIETLNTFAFLDGGSLPTDIALLKALSKAIPQCQYFEIGTWRGESVANVAESAETCYTLNLSKADMLSLGLKESYADLHGFFSKSIPNIIHLEGNSMNYNFGALNKKFDLVFIDGNHHYDFVKNDTAKVFAHLLHEHSIVVWHDYAYTPEKVRPEVFAGILEGIPKECRKHLYHVSNTMCAIFTKQDYPTQSLVSPSEPQRVFKVSLTSVRYRK